jgi:hypothetical protein
MAKKWLKEHSGTESFPMQRRQNNYKRFEFVSCYAEEVQSVKTSEVEPEPKLLAVAGTGILKFQLWLRVRLK